MAELVEQTTQGKTTTKWLSSYLTLQNVVLLGAGLVAVISFWNDSKNNWAKIGTKADQNELNTLKEQVKDLEEKVNRQYQTAKDDREREFRAIEEVADWMHYQKGKEDAIKK